MKAKNQKLISALIIIAIILPTVLLSRPQKAEAILPGWISDIFAPLTGANTANSSIQNTTQTVLGLKDLAKEVGKQVLMTIAKRALQQMTKSTVAWINSGFHGSPLFVENPKSFFRDIAKSEVKNFVDLIGYDRLRQPFGRNLALEIIDSYKSQFKTNAEYTLSKVIDDPDLLARYRNDFNIGGWSGFLINTQYPQNNYLGYRMLVTEELAQRLDGTVISAAEEVKETLEQGLGFLSPETCADNNGNNEYNKVMANAWQRPSFKSKTAPFRRPISCSGDVTQESAQCRADLEIANDIWGKEKLVEERLWREKNTCQTLVKTTPGSVVGSQINNILRSSPRQLELAGAMGNSISAVLDALMNHFMNKGLNALASKVNPPKDEWEFEGQSLGSPTDNTNDTWDAGPDEEIILERFKEIVQNSIDNTTLELRLMDNPSGEPGIAQRLGQIWPKTQELDICLPGPDIGWQDRTFKELERNGQKLLEKSNDDDPEEAAVAQQVLQELKFAVDFFQDWINNKMLTELPNSVIYMDAVDEIETIYQQSSELTNAKRAKTSALARLKSIKLNLGGFTTQPIIGSGGEQVLVNLKKQYNAISESLSNTTTIENTKNELAIATEKLANLNNLITKCNDERLATQCNTKDWASPEPRKYWAVPGGRTSLCNVKLANGTVSNISDPRFNGGTVDGVTYDSEQALFCSSPIFHGYDHETFLHKHDCGEASCPVDRQDAVSYPEVPYVNAKHVFNYDKAFGSGDVDISLNCNFIYKANVLDYKKTIPGVTIINPADNTTMEEDR